MQKLLHTLERFKKMILILLFAEIFSLTSVFANPGDTTWVTVYNLRKLTQYGNYDTTATFPTGKRYRKIRMHYILGRYACPAGTQYCGSWDYTTQIYAMPSGKDSAEIARVITPYATDWLSQNKKHDYVVEVTDYATLLEGTTGMRFNYSGYSWGFTITLKLEFIEGVPPMDILSLKKVYDGYFPYGQTNSIENFLTAKHYSYTAPTNRVYLRNTVSGHGSDQNTGCSEFCSKYYTLNLNGNSVSQKQLWRADCGVNNVYPQTGTWIYERSNWCPGAVVWPIYHDLSSLTSANTTFSVDINMQPYTTTNNQAGYFYATHLLQYSSPNHTRDVSIEDILAPTKDANYVRNNPRCDNPIIKIKNTGTDSVKSVVFSYGIQGQTPLTHTWTGALGFLDETEVVFPPSSSILTNTVTTTFEVNLVSVNEINGDQNSFNNTYNSQTSPVAIFPQAFVIKMVTNNLGDNSWTLFDEFNNVVLSQNNLSPNTVYQDTVWSLPYGCYRILLEDGGCDGLSWWANTSQGNATMRIDYINANNTIYLFPTDIGCNFTKYFALIDPNPNMVGISKGEANANIVDVYPNPTQSTAYIKLDLNHAQTINYTLTDINGRVLIQKKLMTPSLFIESVDTKDIANGIYFMSVLLEDNTRITKKLVIQK